MVASDSGTKRRAPRQPRIYLVPPAQWKSARSRTCLDWSNIAAAPCSWSEQQCKPGLDFDADRRLVKSSKIRVFAIARAAAFHQTLRLARRSNTWIVDGVLAAKRAWAAWDRVNQRRALAAFSCCVIFGAIAVPLLAGVAHSQPEYEIRAVRTGSLPPAVITTNIAAPVAVVKPFLTEKTREVESPAVVPKAAPAMRSEAPSSIALLSDVSTMDLMMPIAEPDLNIASRESLWAKVGKEFGVDPLLLYSIALVESRSLHPAGDIGPTPWLFRVNDHLVVGERHHVQMEMAVASQLNATVQDVGIMQVYYPMHRSAVRDPLSLLDPKTNISVAAKILHDGMRETSDPVLGVGYYHSHTQQLARDYGTVVMTVYQRLKGVYRSGKSGQVVAR